MGEGSASPNRDRDSPPRGPRAERQGERRGEQDRDSGDTYRPSDRGDRPDRPDRPDRADRLGPPRGPRNQNQDARRGNRDRDADGDNYRPGDQDQHGHERGFRRDREGEAPRERDRDRERDTERPQRDRDFDRSRGDRDHDRRSRRGGGGGGGGGGFKWKDERRGDDRRRDDRPYRRRSQSPRRRDRFDNRDRPRDSRPNGAPETDRKPATAVSAAPAGGEEMIIVNVNDRLGTKASIPCYASDNIKDFKILVASKIGREPHEILLKRQGERPFKDQLSLEDYGVGNGVQLDLEVDTGD